jgi:hypothetical protein
MVKIPGSKSSYRILCSGLEYINEIIRNDGEGKHSCHLNSQNYNLVLGKNRFLKSDKELPRIEITPGIMELSDYYYDFVRNVFFKQPVPADMYCPGISTKNYLNIIKVFNPKNLKKILLEDKHSPLEIHKVVTQDLGRSICDCDSPRLVSAFGGYLRHLMAMFKSHPEILSETPIYFMIISMMAHAELNYDANGVTVFNLPHIEFSSKAQKSDLFVFGDPLENQADIDVGIINMKFVNFVL